MVQKNDVGIRLGRLELQIMSVVWKLGKATVHNVRDAITQERRTPAYTTIQTMMRRLEDRGYLEHEEVDRTYVYRAKLSRRKVRYGLVNDLLERVFEGSAMLLVTSLFEQNHVSEDESREISKLIEKYKANSSEDNRV